MLDSTLMTEAMLQASLLQQQQHSQQEPSLHPELDDLAYHDSVMNLHNAILLQQAFQSSSGSPSSNIVAMDNTSLLSFQDQSGQMWSTNGPITHLSIATDQMAELQLAQSSTANSSPVIPNDEYGLRRASTTSIQDVTDWQDKARTERRKVQNRAAQRAYRERKEKALFEMRELLEQKESQLQALQQDHEKLKSNYEQLLSSQRRESDTSEAQESPVSKENQPSNT